MANTASATQTLPGTGRRSCKDVASLSFSSILVEAGSDSRRRINASFLRSRICRA